MRVPALVCLAVIAGTTLAAQANDLGPAPGRLIDLGGRRLHLNCTGSERRWRWCAPLTMSTQPPASGDHSLPGVMCQFSSGLSAM